MLYVKLNDKLKKEFSKESDGEELITWRELKSKLNITEDKYDLKEFLKGCTFHSQRPKSNVSKITSIAEYNRLINSNNNNKSSSNSNTNELQSLRADLSELRKESTWLANCIFTSVGAAAFVFFCASFYLDRFEVKLILSTVIGIILFFLEVILYIIRN